MFLLLITLVMYPVSIILQVLGDALLGNIVFMTMLFLEVQFILKLSFDIRRYIEYL
jgi:hypothetical protein